MCSHDPLIIERFAKKVVRIFGSPARCKEIEDMNRNEYRVTAKLWALGGHANIITVLRHGTVRDTGMFYFNQSINHIILACRHSL